MTVGEFQSNWNAARTLLQVLEVCGRAIARAPGSRYPKTPAQDDARREVIEALAGVYRRIGKTHILTRAVREALVPIRDRAIASQPSLKAAADVLLTGFDAALGAVAARAFEATAGTLSLGEGTVFPIATHDLKALLGGHALSPRPTSTRHVYDARAFLDVATGLSPDLRITFDFAPGPGVLNRFVEAPVVGVALPNTRVSELDLVTDLPRRKFFNVRPRDPAMQEERLRSVLRTASDASVPLVLLPELSTTPALAERIGEWVQGDLGAISLAVAGSHHGPDPKPTGVFGHNRCVAHGPGLAAPLVHDKFSPYILKEWDSREYDPPLVEDIDAGNKSLTVRWSMGWSFTTLVCKDFLDHTLVAALRVLRPNLVLVAAFSPDTANFVSAASDLAVQSQAIVVVANFAGGPNADAAIVSTPRRDASRVCHPSGAVGAPCVLIVSLKDSKVTWRSDTG
jgi:hypothetical protein